MTQYDAPNQQAVRPDASGPWDEGEGGSTRKGGSAVGGHQAQDDEPKLESLTKDELLDLAEERDVDVDTSMKKAEIIAALED